MPGIDALIGQQIKLVRQLLAMLDEEQQALKTAQPDGLRDIGERKTALVEQLNSTDALRSKAIDKLFPGLAPQAAVRRWLDSQPANAAGAQAWATLLDLARQVRAQHDINGQLVRLHMQHTTQALAALQSGSQDFLDIYGSDGQSAAPRPGRISDSA